MTQPDVISQLLKKYVRSMFGSCHRNYLLLKTKNSHMQNTRWFKYDRDYLCVNKSQFVPVIFEPPCINPTILNAGDWAALPPEGVSSTHWAGMDILEK
jgi:hypothetical protein